MELLELSEPREQRIWVSETGEHALVPSTRQGGASPWLALPILHVATVGLAQVRALNQSGRTVYSLPGTGLRLYFARSGKELAIHSEVNGRTGRVGYEVFLQAFETFASTVRELLKREVPELQGHPQWGAWFTGAEAD